MSEVYLADLRYRLGVFKEAFHCDVSAITPDDVATFFDGLKLSPRSHNNFLCALRTFFRFAQKHDWLSKEVDLLWRVEKRNEKPTPVEIFTPSELAALLKQCFPASCAMYRAGCVCRTACGGNHAPGLADVERRPGFIEVAAHKAKTATRRIVPISDNLSRWLAIAPRNRRARLAAQQSLLLRSTAHRC